MFTIITPTIRKQFLKHNKRSLEKQKNKNFEWLIEEGNPKNGFTLPADYNKMLKKAKNKIIVSYQDAIELPEDFLEYLTTLDYEKKAYTFPVGKDWRQHKNGEIKPEEWEIDVAVAPLQMFYDIGGFDESYTDWSFDNVEVAIRASYAGYKFYCDNTLKCKAIDHDSIIKHPFRDGKTNAHRIPLTRSMAKIGQYKLNYLVI